MIDRQTLMHLEGERGVVDAEQSILQHRADVARIECDFLKHADREWWQNCPEKCRAARDPGDQ